MSEPAFSIDDLRTLADMACNDEMTERDAARLEQLLQGNAKAQQFYLKRVSFDAWLRWEVADQVQEPTLPYSLPPSVHGFLSTAYYGTTGYFSHEIPFSFLVGAVLTALLVLVAWLVPVSSFVEIADSKSSIPSVVQREFAPESKMEIVGKITDMIDVKWADINTSTERGNGVFLGRKYALASGLMEISYRTGAKVILQGPVTYTVDSRDGGFLSAGKLTARLEKRGVVGDVEVASGQRSVVSEDNPKSAFPLSPSTFVVRTPTATITDLGTEFGVAVAEQGDVRVHVFAGVVDFQCISQDRQSREGHRLVAGNSAQIKSGKITVSRKAPPATDFVRVVRNPASTPATPISGTLAYWRFEDNVPSLDVSKQSKTQINVVHDSSDCQNHLDYYGSWGDDGIGNYVASRFVPPSSMFRPGYSGGFKSFNSAALAPNKCGVLFSDSLRHGSPFDFNGPFTLEGFYRTDGNQSRAGPMGIIFKGECSPAYMVSLNRSSLGSAELTLFDAKGKTFVATVADRNYADGQWHYFAARYQVNQDKGGGTVSMLVANENGTVAGSVTATPPEFTLNWPNANLFVGRIAHWPLDSVSGHFRGLIDEIRICRGALADTDLLFPLQQHKSVSNGGKGLQ